MEADGGAAAEAPPAEYDIAAAHVAACKRAAETGASAPAPPFARGSEAFWWDALLAAVKAHDGIYSGAKPLISPPGANLSRTPREEAELRGLARAEDWLAAGEAAVAAPGAGVRLHGLQSHFNSRLGRVLPSTGPGAPPEAASPGRVAVRLAGASARVLAIKPANLLPAVVLSGPKKLAKPRPPTAWSPASYAERVKQCARFLEVPLPPEAPAGAYCVGLRRSPARDDVQGAQLECHFLSAVSDVPEREARRVMERHGRVVGDPISACVQVQLAASAGLRLAPDEFIITRTGFGAYMTAHGLVVAGVAEDTGRTLALPGEPPSPVLRCLLPAPAPPGRAYEGGSIQEALANMFPPGSSANGGFSPVLLRNNPAMPCAFELGWPADVEWPLQVEVPLRAFDAPGIQQAHWSSPAAAEAAELALTALVVSPQKTTSYCDKALAVCEHCGDAWTARAMKCSRSWEEALDMYHRAVAEATAALAPVLLEEMAEMRGMSCAEREVRNMRTLWQVHPVRPLVRAMAGLANTLRRLRRWAEASDVYRALHAMDPESHFGNSFWINWKTHVPETLMAAGCTAEARAYMCHLDNVKCFSWASSCVNWVATSAVLDASSFCNTPADAKQWPGEAFIDGLKNANRIDAIQHAEATVRGKGEGYSGGTVVSFASHYAVGIAWMLGLPEAPPLPHMSRMGPHVQGESKDLDAMAAWALQGSKEALEAASPGALLVLRRVLRTVALQDWLSGTTLVHTKPEVSLPAPDVGTAVAWIAAGDVYANARFGFCTLLSHAARSTAAGVGVEVTRALLAAGADTCDQLEQHGRAPITQWAYYAGPLATGKLLLQPRTCKSGDEQDPELCHVGGHLLDAAFMAANQCNGAQLAALLGASLNVTRGMLQVMGADVAEVHNELLTNVLGSTVPMCLDTQGAEPCQRCTSRDKAHSPNASLARTLGVLVAAGVLDPGPSSTSMAQARRIVKEHAGNAPLLRRWEAEHGAALRRRDASACALCGSGASGAKRCSRCKAVRFCGEECAAAAWPTHKAVCTPAAGAATKKS